MHLCWRIEIQTEQELELTGLPVWQHQEPIEIWTLYCCFSMIFQPGVIKENWNGGHSSDLKGNDSEPTVMNCYARIQDIQISRRIRSDFLSAWLAGWHGDAVPGWTDDFIPGGWFRKAPRWGHPVRSDEETPPWESRQWNIPGDMDLTAVQSPVKALWGAVHGFNS